MELVGKVLLVWIEPIRRASHDGGITDGSLDNCGQKLDDRGLDIRAVHLPDTDPGHLTGSASGHPPPSRVG
jgi:hypothetical protein